MTDKEYIDREALLEWAREFYPNDKQFISAVINAPKAAVQEIKHGSWEYDSGDVGYTNYLCSECKNFLTFYEEIDLYPYCPYCGAKMNKEREK